MSGKPLRIPAGLVSAVVALLIWQIATTWGPLAGSSVPTATSTLAELWNLLFMSETWDSIWQTIQMALYGFLIAVAIAIPVGILIGLSRFAYRSTKFTFDFFKVIPPIVLIPIAILVIGPSIAMGVWLVDNYRTQFSQEINAKGVDGLIATLSERNKANSRK